MEKQDKQYMALYLGLSNGQNFLAVLDPPEAERLFSLYQEASLPVSVGDHNFKGAPGPSWRVRSDQIVYVRVLTAEEVSALQLQAQQQAQQARGAKAIPHTGGLGTTWVRS